MVPRHAARSSDSRDSETPARRAIASAIFSAMPQAASSFSGYVQPGCRGLTTMAPAGSSSGTRWWSVTMTSTPGGRAPRRRPSTAVMPQSTVTMTAGESSARTRRTVSGFSP